MCSDQCSDVRVRCTCGDRWRASRVASSEECDVTRESRVVLTTRRVRSSELRTPITRRRGVIGSDERDRTDCTSSTYRSDRYAVFTCVRRSCESRHKQETRRGGSCTTQVSLSRAAPLGSAHVTRIATDRTRLRCAVNRACHRVSCNPSGEPARREKSASQRASALALRWQHAALQRAGQRQHELSRC